MSRRFVILSVALLLFFLGGGWTLRNQLAADRQGDWVRVTRGDLVTGVDVTGTLASAQATRLGPPQLEDLWDFKISMLAPEGSDVKAGEPVLGFDTSELRKRLDEKTAEADQARKEIEKRRADLKLKSEDEKMNLADAEGRMRKAALKLETPSDIFSVKERKQVELDHALAERECRGRRARLVDLQRAAEAEIGLLESKRSRAAAVVAQTQAAIHAMTVVAPRAGTVVYVQNWRGDKKKVGDTCWRAERLVEIPDLHRMIANGEVDEVDAGKVTVGQHVTLRLDARPDDEIRGTITNVARTLQLQSSQMRDPVKILRVDIALDRSDPSVMRPGMRFQGTIELGRTRNALLIPREAVFIGPNGAKAVRRGVFATEDVPLKVGRRNDKSVEVLGGLNAGDRVLQPKNETEKEKS